MPVSWIHKMNETNGRLDKESTIEKAVAAYKLGDKGARWFLMGAYMAYNSYLTYNIKKVPLTDGIEDGENPLDEFKELLSLLSLRKITGNEALGAVDAMSQRFDSDTWNNFCAAVIKKDLRVGATLKTFNKYLKGTEFEIPVFECQLATDSNKHQKKLTGVKFIQRKLDGVRVIAVCRNGTCALYSRNGKPLENFEFIRRQIEDVSLVIGNAMSTKEFVLDGEVMSNSFQDLMKQVHRKSNAQTDDAVFHIFDVLHYSAFYKGVSKIRQRDRLNTLTHVKYWVDQQPSLTIEDHMQVDLSLNEGHNQMQRYAEDCVAQGYEGIMIKDETAVYECKRSTNWMKWKPVITVDLEVVNVEEGTGRNKGRLGALVCQGIDDGREIHVNVGSGLSDGDRDAFWADRDSLLGHTVEIKADAITQNQDGTYSLRFPRFERFRTVEIGSKI
jgi:DNA ligase-1